jgi:hypothetical protein
MRKPSVRGSSAATHPTADATLLALVKECLEIEARHRVSEDQLITAEDRRTGQSRRARFCEPKQIFSSGCWSALPWAVHIARPRSKRFACLSQPCPRKYRVQRGNKRLLPRRKGRPQAKSENGQIRPFTYGYPPRLGRRLRRRAGGFPTAVTEIKRYPEKLGYLKAEAPIRGKNSSFDMTRDGSWDWLSPSGALMHATL